MPIGISIVLQGWKCWERAFGLRESQWVFDRCEKRLMARLESTADFNDFQHDFDLQASKKHHSNIQSVSMSFQHLGPYRVAFWCILIIDSGLETSGMDPSEALVLVISCHILSYGYVWKWGIFPIIAIFFGIMIINHWVQWGTQHFQTHPYLVQVPIEDGWKKLASKRLLSQENRQKWREFCYGFENLKEWGDSGFLWFFYGFSIDSRPRGLRC